MNEYNVNKLYDFVATTITNIKLNQWSFKQLVRQFVDNILPVRKTLLDPLSINQWHNIDVTMAQHARVVEKVRKYLI